MNELKAKGLTIETAEGRQLVRDLHLSLGREKVAMVGRNGSGKSSLLAVLAGETTPTAGRTFRRGTVQLVPQTLGTGEGKSPGQARRAHLEHAFASAADFLLLDEPSQDLDEAGIEWLKWRLVDFDGGLLVVTHDRALLRTFRHFFVVEERGCWAFSGTYDELVDELWRVNREASRRYATELAQLVRKERHNVKIRQRRARKKAGGRVRELDRCPARACLNNKRGYAQLYQGKREGVRLQRIEAARQFARANRRALEVQLPLALSVPQLLADSGQPSIELSSVRVVRGGNVLIADLSLTIARERIAVHGPNGSGKSTLLQVMVGERSPDAGDVRVRRDRVGYVSQHAENWNGRESLVERLLHDGRLESQDEIAQVLAVHHFPLALALRPLVSLSPGERTRAALILLFCRAPAIDTLVLDEPTDQLDLVGVGALEEALSSWAGGLVVVSHDREFLERVRTKERLVLGEPRAPLGSTASRPGRSRWPAAGGCSARR